MDEFSELSKLILQITNVNNMNNLDLAWCYTKEMLFRLKKDDRGYKNTFMREFTKIVKKV